MTSSEKHTSHANFLYIQMLDTALDAATLSIGGRIKFASDGNGNLDVTTTLFYPTDVSDEDMEEDAGKVKPQARHMSLLQCTICCTAAWSNMTD